MPWNAVAAATGLDAESLVRGLEAHPLAKAPQRLLALDLQIQQEPARAAELIERGVAAHREGGAETLQALGAWLSGKGEFARLLAVVPLARAAETRALFLQHLDALAALGRWQEIETLLQGQRFPLDLMVQEMYLARCAAQLDRGPGTVANHWQRALEAALASGDTGKLLSFGDYAEKNGALDVAESAYTHLARSAPRLRPAQGGRLRVAQSQGDLGKTHTVLREMLAVWPDEAPLQNDEAYLGLLLGRTTDSPAAEALAARLMEQNPTSLPHRVLLALARLKGAQPERAIEAFANIRVEPQVATPSAVAVHAAALAAAGQSAAAREEAASVDVAKLSEPERALIEGLRR